MAGHTDPVSPDAELARVIQQCLANTENHSPNRHKPLSLAYEVRITGVTEKVQEAPYRAPRNPGARRQCVRCGLSALAGDAGIASLAEERG